MLTLAAIVMPWAPAWGVLTLSPIVVDSKVKVSFSEFEFNERTKTSNGRATLTNRSTQPVSTPIRLVITNIRPGSVSLANATGLLGDGSRYVDVPVSDGTLSPGEIVKNVLLKFNNPRRARFTFSHSVLGVIPQANHPPVAVAIVKPNQSTFVGTAIALDGSGSYDVDGDPLTYRWSLDPTQPTNAVVIDNKTAIQPNVTLNQKGTWQLKLVVNDGKVDSAPANVTITTENSIPVAIAGAGQTVFVGQTANLDGGGSTDKDSDPLTYLWNLSAKPPTSVTTLLNSTTQTPSLTPDKPGSYTIELTVNDGLADSVANAASQVIIDTKNSKPVADAGADQLNKTVGSPVALDGSQSSDVDGDPLSHLWSLISKPLGSSTDINLADKSKVITTFTPDTIGDYVGQLIVNDGHENSLPDNALVTVTVGAPANHPPTFTSSPALAATVGSPYVYKAQANDVDGDTLVYGLTTYPTGMLINTQTGDITWTPGVNQTGPQLVIVSVTANQDTVTQNYTITVAPAGLITVPNLVGLSRSSAENAIINAQLTVGTPTFVIDPANSGNVLSQIPNAGAAVALGTSITMTVSLGPNPGLPPDPATVAPPVENGVATILAKSTEFLYSGSNPIQTNVAPGTIDAKRAAVIRGKVMDATGNPLPGAIITLLNHPELGQTLSRTDGWFDLAVNGGGQLTVNYRLSGYIPVQRQVQVPWQDFVQADDVVMVSRDPTVTTLNFTAAAAPQIARGSVTTDTSGSRQATVLFPAGTTAQIYNPDGSTQTVNTLHLHFTEFTVGDNGLKAMPAPLPPTSAYTYALEFGADEVTTKIAGKDVLFNQPVYFYLDNFLNFPVGIQVPVGYYDQDKAAWIPSPDGRIVKIVSITNGLADLDTDGNNLADNNPVLGITDAERTQLASLYAVGKSLERIPVSHFSTYDPNYGSGCPAGQTCPDPKPDPITDGDNSNNDNNGKINGDNHNGPTECEGSIIECENQILGETVSVSGTPFSVNYRSDRVPGRKTANTLHIPLSGATVASNLQRIDLTITVAGRTVQQSFTPAPNQSFTFVWDGLDAYGNALQGLQPVSTRIGYTYAGVYNLPPSVAASFGFNSGQPVPGNIPSRVGVTKWMTQAMTVGVPVGPKGLSDALGSWTLSEHHSYDPNGKLLYLGTGDRRSSNAIGSLIITTVAGNGAIPNFLTPGDGGQATSANLNPRGVVVGADGSLYIEEQGRIRRVGPDGIITTVAGIGQGGFCGDCGDGGPATSAVLSAIGGLAVGADGSFYITEQNTSRIRRVGPDGIITTVAGNGIFGFSGDGGPATSARLALPGGIAVGADGSLYIADSANCRIRRVGPDGIITTVAGNGSCSYSGDGGPATSAGLGIGSALENGLAVGADGSLYIVDTDSGGSSSSRIRRVSPDGIITTVAGNGARDFGGDGGPATSTALSANGGLAVGADGSLYIADNFNNLRRVGPDGVITTIAGNGTRDFGGDGGPAILAGLAPFGVAVGADGSIYVVDQANYRIRRLKESLPGFSVSDLAIPSSDGMELYQFNPSGRHLKTLNALTGAIKYQFVYNASGQLTSVTDGDDNVTTIERDGIGNATAIVAPFGQRTTLTLDANGYLASITNPSGEAHHITYSADGLLATFSDPKGNTSTMAYDPLGRLLTDTNAAGGSQTLARTELINGGYIASRATPLGRKTTHRIEFPSAGGMTRTDTQPDATVTTRAIGTDGSTKTTLADGTLINSLDGPDPRFTMLAPIPKSIATTTGGLTSTQATARSVTLSDPNNPLSLTTLTDTVTLNGRTATSTYNAATKTTTTTSAAGRTATGTIDTQGRLLSAQVSRSLGYNQHLRSTRPPQQHDPRG